MNSLPAQVSAPVYGTIVSRSPLLPLPSLDILDDNSQFAGVSHHEKRCERPRHVDSAWCIVNGENSIIPRLTETEKEEAIECINQKTQLPDKVCGWSADIVGKSTQFGHIIPYSENFIPGQGLWLRMGGLLSCDYRTAEEQKVRTTNLILRQHKLASNMDYHIKGVIYLPTMKTAKELVQCGEERLKWWASERDNIDFRNWSGNDLTKNWPISIISKLVIGENDNTTVVDDSIHVFECTMYIVHLTNRPSQQLDCFEYIRLDRTIKGDPNRLVDEQETWHWTSHRDNDGKRLFPRPVFRQQYHRRSSEEELAEAIRVEGGEVQNRTLQRMPEDEPKVLIPFEPATAIMACKAQVQKLVSEGWSLSQYMQDLMKVLEWFLVLAESDNPLYMWQHVAKRPTQLLDTELGDIPEARNDTARISQFNFDEYKFSPQSGREDREPEGSGTSILGDHESSRDARFDSWCGFRKEEDIYWDYNGSETSSVYVPDDFCKHERCFKALVNVEARSRAALAAEADIAKEWLSKHGLGWTMAKLRHDPPQEKIFEALKKRHDAIVETISICRDHCGKLAENEGLFVDDLAISSQTTSKADCKEISEF